MAHSVYLLFFFPETHLQVRPLSGFLCAMAQTMRSHARMCLLGVKNMNLIFNIFIHKIPKNYNGAYWENQTIL